MEGPISNRDARTGLEEATGTIAEAEAATRYACPRVVARAEHECEQVETCVNPGPRAKVSSLQLLPISKGL
jgi:hypothetical protein